MLGRLRGRHGAVDKAAAQRHREAGRAAYERGDHATALAELKRSADADPRSAWTWLFMAQAQRKTGDRDASYAAVRRALELRPDEPSANWHLIEMLEEDGRREECRARVLALCRAQPDDAPILRRASETLARLGDVGAAMALARGRGGGGPMHAEAVGAIAAGLEAAGAEREAQEVLVSSFPPGTSATAVANAAYLRWHGRPLEAWELVRSLPPAEVGASLLVKLGRALRARGDLEAAKDASAAAATLEPEDGRAQRMAEFTRGIWVRTSGEWHATPTDVQPVEGVPGRILHIVTRCLPYSQVGYTIRTHYVTQGQRELGLEPHIATQYGFPITVGHEDAPAEETVDGIPHHHLLPPDDRPLGPPDERMTASLEGLASLVHRIRPSVIHAASDYRNGLLALRLGELYGLPVVYEVRGFWEESWLTGADRDATSDEYRLRQERDTECMLRADAVVTLSEGMAEQIVARGVPAAKITLVPNGVDTDHFVPVGRDPALARRLGIDPDEVTLGYISTFSPYEGIEYLLRAGAELIRRGRPVRVVLVGDGTEHAELQRLASDLAIGERVTFTGRVPHDEVLAYYGLIDVFVVPRIDARVSHLVTPLKPLEAMATGRALVVSDVDALRGMVEVGVSADVFRPQDPMHLADVADALVLDGTRRAALGAAARAWVVENRSWKQLARSYLDVYRTIGAAVRGSRRG
jgi:glycosyltransferase involved in cell wall biosynthesis/tetratricopeptide (TPR) repeat protein